MEKNIPILPYNTLKETLDDIDNAQHRCFLKTTYFSLGRVGEIVNTRSKEYPNPAIKKSNFEITKNFLIVNLKTEKRQTQRRVPVARIDLVNEQYFKRNEAWITEDIITYLSYLEKDRAVWDWSTRWGEMVFKKYFPEHKNHIHCLRHWRASHLLAGYATGAKIPAPIVAKLGGWKGTGTLTATYDGTIPEEYIDAMGELI